MQLSYNDLKNIPSITLPIVRSGQTGLPLCLGEHFKMQIELDFKIEVWRDIEGFGGRYRISSYGNVKSFTKKSNGKILKFINCVRSYNVVGLYQTNKIKFYKVHRLVAQAFIPNPNNLPMVNHRDNIGSNNYFENLEWSDNRSNQTHRRLLENTSSSKYTGVSWDKRAGRWESYFTVDKKKKHLGYFQNELDAHNRYLLALRENGLINQYAK